MLQEVKNIQQIPGEPYRRLFYSPTIDLFVWFDPLNQIIGFQLSYRESESEHAVTWFADRGFVHNEVDSGEGHPGRTKMSPILVRDGIFKPAQVIEYFKQEGHELESEIVEFIIRKLREYPI